MAAAQWFLAGKSVSCRPRTAKFPVSREFAWRWVRSALRRQPAKRASASHRFIGATPAQPGKTTALRLVTRRGAGHGLCNLGGHVCRPGRARFRATTRRRDSRRTETEIPACRRWSWTLPLFARDFFLGTLLGTLNDLPKVPARKRRGGEVLRGMRFGPGTCLCELRHSNFADGQVLLTLRSFHGSGRREVLVFALYGTETANSPSSG